MWQCTCFFIISSQISDGKLTCVSVQDSLYPTSVTYTCSLIIFVENLSDACHQCLACPKGLNGNQNISFLKITLLEVLGQQGF